MKKRINPKRIILAVRDLFNPVLGKHALRNMILSMIAIALSPKMRVNEISRHLPTKVKGDKHKQKRLLRFLDRGIPTSEVMELWAKYVLNTLKPRVIIVDETDLPGGFKAIVAAVPFRKRAVPIYFMTYSHEQIDEMKYLSWNQIVDMFVDKLFQILMEALGKKGEKVVWLFDRGFADSRFMERIKGRIVFVIRVRKDCWVEVEGKERYAGRLEGFKRKGFFERVLYQKDRKLELRMYSDPYGDDPMFLVSNSAKGLHLIYKLRAQIEQGFRDIKNLYGFKHLELRKKNQERIEMLLCLVSITMGLLMVGYEKSGYRWRKEVYRRKQVYSLVRAIKRVIEDSWKGLELEPYFPLSL